MKIIIPMTGEGGRFVSAGYQVLKPLIEVEGKTIIEHVVNLFPGEKDVVFICRDEHLWNTNMRDVLQKVCPSAKIVSISGHKLGPVYSVSKVYDLISDDEPVVINYCDFYMDWDWEDFKKTMVQNECDACLPSYQGFHPHLLPEQNFYASMKVDTEYYLREIKEKHSYTPSRMDCPQSPGTFYFKKGKDVKKYFDQMLVEKIELNGEYYVSLVCNLLVRDGLRIFVYDKVPYFCQWGTPEDLEEYLEWSNFFKRNFNEKNFDIVWQKALGEEKLRGRANYNDATLNRIFNYWRNFFTKTSLHYLSK